MCHARELTSEYVTLKSTKSAPRFAPTLATEIIQTIYKWFWRDYLAGVGGHQRMFPHQYKLFSEYRMYIQSFLAASATCRAWHQAVDWRITVLTVFDFSPCFRGYGNPVTRNPWECAIVGPDGFDLLVKKTDDEVGSLDAWAANIIFPRTAFGFLRDLQQSWVSGHGLMGIPVPRSINWQNLFKDLEVATSMAFLSTPYRMAGYDAEYVVPILLPPTDEFPALKWPSAPFFDPVPAGDTSADLPFNVMHGSLPAMTRPDWTEYQSQHFLRHETMQLETRHEPTLSGPDLKLALQTSSATLAPKLYDMMGISHHPTVPHDIRVLSKPLLLMRLLFRISEIHMCDHRCGVCRRYIDKTTLYNGITGLCKSSCKRWEYTRNAGQDTTHIQDALEHPECPDCKDLFTPAQLVLIHTGLNSIYPRFCVDCFMTVVKYCTSLVQTLEASMDGVLSVVPQYTETPFSPSSSGYQNGASSVRLFITQTLFTFFSNIHVSLADTRDAVTYPGRNHCPFTRPTKNGEKHYWLAQRKPKIRITLLDGRNGTPALSYLRGCFAPTINHITISFRRKAGSLHPTFTPTKHSSDTPPSFRNCFLFSHGIFLCIR
ncbi:hypothetical protein DFS34DRAFT_636837 [Phlyctochytrium arcticum]|nr:hypothetical protein DFS34DRAFT_636837 [Phlyctochytrium arcticum]